MNETPITLGQLMQVTLWQCMPVCLNIETEPLGYEDIYNWDCYWETPIDNDHFFKFIQKYKDNLVEQCYMNHQADDYPDIFTVEVSIFTAEDLKSRIKDVVSRRKRKIDRFGDIFFRDFVEINGIWYMIDMRHTIDAGNECMAFRCAKSGEVTSGEDVWSKRGMMLTRREFNKCKREFISYMKSKH